MTATTPILSVRSLSASYGAATVLHDVSFTVGQSERWAVIGRNGSGKSTLVKCLASLLRPASGEILIDNRPLARISSRQRARLISYVPQATGRTIPFTVYDYVMLGRYAWQGAFATPSRDDHEAVGAALALTDMTSFAYRSMSTLSGGEAQRVFLAGAVAQHAHLLLLDEPTTFLDPHHDALFYGVLERIHEEYDVTVVAVTHDVNAAINRYTHVLALRDGRTFFAGNVGEFMTRSPSILQDIFDISFRRFVSPEDQAILFGQWMSRTTGEAR